MVLVQLNECYDKNKYTKTYTKIKKKHHHKNSAKTQVTWDFLF